MPFRESIFSFFGTIRDGLGEAVHSEWGADMHDSCVEATPIVADATGDLYAYGTETVTGSAALGQGVGHVIGHTVEEGWPHVCDLPNNIYEATGDAPEAADMSVGASAFSDANAFSGADAFSDLGGMDAAAYVDFGDMSGSDSGSGSDSFTDSGDF
jgi:hypothetical protein